MSQELACDHLPIPDRPYAGPVYLDAKDPQAKLPPIEPLRPPADAPNLLVILLDGVGFGAASAFGGPCATPIAERLAAGGLKLNRSTRPRCALRPIRSFVGFARVALVDPCSPACLDLLARPVSTVKLPGGRPSRQIGAFTLSSDLDDTEGRT
jgi:hypothetical protein